MDNKDFLIRQMPAELKKALKIKAAQSGITLKKLVITFLERELKMVKDYNEYGNCSSCGCYIDGRTNIDGTDRHTLSESQQNPVETPNGTYCRDCFNKPSK